MAVASWRQALRLRWHCAGSALVRSVCVCVIARPDPVAPYRKPWPISYCSLNTTCRHSTRKKSRVQKFLSRQHQYPLGQGQTTRVDQREECQMRWQSSKVFREPSELALATYVHIWITLKNPDAPTVYPVACTTVSLDLTTASSSIAARGHKL